MLTTFLCSALPAKAIQHPTAQAGACFDNGDGNEFFSDFVNISGGLYWTGGFVNGDDDRGVVYLQTNVPDYPARTVTMQYFLGCLSSGSQTCRDAYVSIVFTDGSDTEQYVEPGADITRGFSITPTAHGFNNLTWNAAAAGMTGKCIDYVYFVDEGSCDSYQTESFQDYVTRVYVDGVLAVPQVHQPATCEE
jgi:hypothetical protein